MKYIAQYFSNGRIPCRQITHNVSGETIEEVMEKLSEHPRRTKADLYRIDTTGWTLMRENI